MCFGPRVVKAAGAVLVDAAEFGSQIGFNGLNHRSLLQSDSVRHHFSSPSLFTAEPPAREGTAYVPSSVHAICHTHDHLKSHALFDICSRWWNDSNRRWQSCKCIWQAAFSVIHLNSLLRLIISDCLSTVESKPSVIHEGHTSYEVFT